MCEMMVRLVCHSNLRECDDETLTGATIASGFCGLCALTAEENVKHLVMQCPLRVAGRLTQNV